MQNIALRETLAKLPVAELQVSIQEFIEPMTKNLPDKRLQAVFYQSVQGILARPLNLGSRNLMWSSDS